MVTENKYPTVPLELYGKSTDAKPTTEFRGLPVTNGSTFFEVDTGDVYIFDKASSTWNAV